jgi:hypothetical protein
MTLKELINSDRYKKSDYTIYSVNDKYALKHKRDNKYADLRSSGHHWNIKTGYFKDCLGDEFDIIEAFERYSPEIKEYECVEIKDSSEKSIELSDIQLYRKQLEEGML